MKKRNLILLITIPSAVIVLLVVLFIVGLMLSSSSYSTGTSSDNVQMLSRSAAPMAGFASMDMEESSFAKSMPIPEPPRGGETAAETEQKIIKTGSLSLVVDSVAESVEQITNLATQKGGFVQNSSVSERNDGSHYGSITLRVPSREFENSLSEIKDLANLVENETARGQDVTEEFTDLQARLG
ncbi:DUF4349 domain-containing protein, partial [Patescibacteria group bacterium]